MFNDLKGILKIRPNKKYPNIIEVFIDKTEKIKDLSSLELSIYYYPYSRNLKSTSFEFLPYEEFIEDLTSSERSAYREVSTGEKQFGLLIGFLITLVFALIDSSLLLSVEALVSILGAYTIGKELWNDIDNSLAETTMNWPVRWTPMQYFYKRQNFGTIQKYWDLARLRRTSTENYLPSQLDLISQSNAETVEMYFSKSDLAELEDSDNLVLYIHTSRKQEKEYARGSMIGTKITISKSFLGFKKNIELFQSLDKGKVISIDDDDVTHADTVFFRKTLSFGRIKIYLGKGIKKQFKVISA